MLDPIESYPFPLSLSDRFHPKEREMREREHAAEWIDAVRCQEQDDLGR